jgi:hypothetical protein
LLNDIIEVYTQTGEEELSPNTSQINIKSKTPGKGDLAPSLYLNNLSTKGQAGQYKMVDENDQSQAYVPYQ